MIKFKRNVIAALLTVVMVGAVFTTPAQAADKKTDSYSLYYNSPGSANTTAFPSITWYGGTNYFQVSDLWGSGSYWVVSCSGTNVNMNTLSASNTGTMQFTFTSVYAGNYAKYKVVMSNSKSGTSYAKGKIYIK